LFISHFMSFFYDACEKHRDNQSIILHGNHTMTGNRWSFFVFDFFPFIGVRNTNENLEKILRLEDRGVIVRKEFYTPRGLSFHDLYKKNVIKIYLNSTQDVAVIRQNFDLEESYQDDVIYTTVFKTEKNIHVGFIVKNFGSVYSKREKIILDTQKQFKDKTFVEKYGDRLKRFVRITEKDIIGF